MQESAPQHHLNLQTLAFTHDMPTQVVAILNGQKTPIIFDHLSALPDHLGVMLNLR
jgi:hypothetical protein